jgi:hypothetical protein
MVSSGVFVWWLSCVTGAFAQPAVTPRVPHVIVIGVDGLSVDAVNVAPTPRLHELMNRSAWTLEARGVMPTLSSPNWESAIGGAPPEQHGITSNGHLRKLVEFAPACHDAEGKFPTIFGVLREQKPGSSIAVFHDWKDFRDLVETHAADVMKHESGAAQTTDAAVQYWKAHLPMLLFVHLDNVDQAGHESGWGTKSYYRAVTDADTYIGRILDMVDQASARESTFVLITSDHGGTRRGHGRNSLAEIQIPWLLAGPGVGPGRIQGYVNTYDTAVTLAWIFDLDPPLCWTGRPVLAAFRATAISAKTGGHGIPQPGCAPLKGSDTVLANVGQD